MLVTVVTGDAPATAIAISRQVGIVTDAAGVAIDSISKFTREYDKKSIAVNKDPNAIESQIVAANKNLSFKLPVDEFIHTNAVNVNGDEFEKMTPTDWDFVFAHKEIVFSRVSPEQKLDIVKECQARGHRVGVTGDGVNDSPALKAADVGIAMQSGSDVAKDAASIVLLDDNFDAIENAMIEGRLIVHNLRKVIAYQISAGCWCELIPVLATFFLGMTQPLSSFLMIIISCVTDASTGIALMCEPPETDILNDPPRNPKKDPLISYTIIGYSYLFWSNIVNVSGFVNYFYYMNHRASMDTVPNPVPLDDDGHRVFPSNYSPAQMVGAWNWGLNSGNLGSDEAAASSSASSVYYVTIVVTQWFHVLSIRRKSPYFVDAIMDTKKVGGSVLKRIWDELMESRPRKEMVIVIIFTACVANFFNETPFMHTYCGTGHVPAVNWGIALGFGIAAFINGEIRKWILLLYPDSTITKYFFFKW